MRIGVIACVPALLACASARDRQVAAGADEAAGHRAECRIIHGLASRTAGVAPLAVFFDVVDADVVLPPRVGGRRDYSAFHYKWTFGDPSSGTWAVKGTSKNAAVGHVAAHVFERPGIYNVSLEVTDSQGRTHAYGTTITVRDPDEVYRGHNTVCLSRLGDFTGCPTGALKARGTTLDALQSHIGRGKRVLLRRGERWEVSSSVGLARLQGPFTIGAFGSCSDPDERSICANAPVLHATGTGLQSIVRLNRIRDVRIMDLSFTSESLSGSATEGTTDLQEVLLLRLRAEGFDVPLLGTHWVTEGHDQYMIVDSDVRRCAGNPVFAGSERLVVMGNRLRDSFKTHVLRVWQAHKAVIAHNELSGSSLQSDSGRHALKLHGPEEAIIGTNAPQSLARRTQHVIVADNLFGGSGPWPVSIAPQDRQKDERLSDVLVERNLFLAGFGNLSDKSLPVSVALRLCARGLTIRNNVFSGAGADDGYRAIHIVACGAAPVPSDIRILNNTVRKTDLRRRTPELIGVAIDERVTGVLIRNNLFHFAEGVGAVAVQTKSPHVVHDHNLLAGDDWFSDSGGGEFLPTGLSLVAQSPAVDSGYPAQVFEDFAGRKRPSGAQIDVGAFER